MQDYIEAVFFAWLANRISPTKKDRIRPHLIELEKMSNKAGIIRGGLFSNLNLSTAKRIQKMISEDTAGRAKQKRQYNTFDEVVSYLVAFAAEVDGADSDNANNEAPLTEEEIPYSKRYAISDVFYGKEIVDCGFSYRVENRLLKMEIQNVEALLSQSDASLLNVRGLGQGCLDEIHKRLSNLAVASPDTSPTAIKVASGVKFTQELDRYKRSLYSGDFSFTENKSFSKKSNEIIDRFRDAYDTLDPVLLEQIRQNAPGASTIYQILNDFVVESSAQAAADSVLSTIPKVRTKHDAAFVIGCYTSHPQSLQYFSSKLGDKQTLEQFVRTNIDAVNEAPMAKFLTWCKSDLITDINTFFQSTLTNERNRLIFQGRVRGETLQDLGERFEITRERVRQIDAKIVRKAREWFLRSRTGQRLFLDLSEDNFLPVGVIIDYVGEFGPETVSIFKECCGKEYFYDNVLDGFTLNKPSDYSVLNDFFDSLPDMLREDVLDDMLAKAGIKEKYLPEAIAHFLEENFNHTGSIYHRSRFSLTNVYSETLRKFYPDGMHMDDGEIAKFKEHVNHEYQIDLSDKNTRSIITIISKVGFLCGRGRYKPRDERDQISPQLARKIRIFIERNPSPIIWSSAIYNVFEAPLKQEGIDNRYYMFSILKELFGDKWFFRKDYVSKDKSISSLYDAIVDFISSFKYPITKEELLKHFPGITDVSISQAIADSDVLNLFGSYVSASRLTLDDDDVSYFKRKLEQTLTEGDICYVRDLYSEIYVERPGLLSRNFITTGFKLFSVLEYLFSEDYNFSRPFIAREGAEIKSIQSVLKEIVFESDVIAFEDVRAFADDHNYAIASVTDFCASCNDSHLMINARELASMDHIGITEEIARTVEQLILDEVTTVTPIANLKCISQFPKLKIEWNAWLVYSLLRKWSKKLSVSTTKMPIKVGYPVVAPSGTSLEFEYEPNIPRDGKLFTTDDLDNLDELIADYVLEDYNDLEDLDEF